MADKTEQAEREHDSTARHALTSVRLSTGVSLERGNNCGLHVLSQFCLALSHARRFSRQIYSYAEADTVRRSSGTTEVAGGWHEGSLRGTSAGTFGGSFGAGALVGAGTLVRECALTSL